MSDILIRGMEMPTTCRDCRLSTFTNFDSMPFCNITMDDICLNDWETKRCYNCPLVPVPPHGDLVERDALLKKCEFVCTDDDVDVRAVRYSVIDAAPTIIPAEPPKEERA